NLVAVHRRSPRIIARSARSSRSTSYALPRSKPQPGDLAIAINFDRAARNAADRVSVRQHGAAEVSAAVVARHIRRLAFDVNAQVITRCALIQRHVIRRLDLVGCTECQGLERRNIGADLRSRAPYTLVARIEIVDTQSRIAERRDRGV